MKKVVLISLISVFAISASFAQKWNTLNRQQKDTVVYNHINKGNHFLSLRGGFSGMVTGGENSIFNYKVGASFGWFVADRMLVALDLNYRHANDGGDSLLIDASKFSFGGFYRYYLLQKERLLQVYLSAGANAGKMWDKRLDTENKEINEDYFLVEVNATAGLAIPINRFTLDIELGYYYQLLNSNVYKDFFGNGFGGAVGFSYVF